MLLIITLLGLISGSFIILGLLPYRFAEGIIKPFQNRKQSMHKKIKNSLSKKKVKGIWLLIRETKEVLEITGRTNKFGALCILSFVLFILGVVFATALQNFYLIPVAAIGMSLLPFWYIVFTAAFYKKQLNNELETALSIITTSYIRNENIITAVEENVDYLNPPVAEAFKIFLTGSKLINSNLKLALESIKYKIPNDVFAEWIDAVIACQEDKTLKITLQPIVSKLSDMRVVSAELEYLLYEPMKEFITMVILLVSNIPLIWFLNKDWFHILVFTDVGKIVLSICTLVIFVSLAAVIRLTRPVEYKR